ncbi:MAG: hypothetical protein JSS27_04065 [Planctomycetes bacterium]|nr:hypothetical protein [Planctomycetota bacterium]
MNLLRLMLTFMILLGSAGVVYLSGVSINLRKQNEQLATQAEQQLKQAIEEGEILRVGDQQARNEVLAGWVDAPISEQLKKGRPGLRQMQTALNDALVGRGRVWDECRRSSANEKGEATVTVAQPTPPGIEAKMLMRVFQKADLSNADTPAGGAYLGEFLVTAVDAQKVSLKPASSMPQRKLDQLANGPGEWVLYEIMPSDRHSAFTGAELGKLIPTSVRPEYARDGQPANEKDPPEALRRVWVRNADGNGAYKLDVPEGEAPDAVPATPANNAKFTESPGSGNYDLKEGKLEDGKFVEGKFYDRPLRDYSVILHELQRHIWVIQDRLATAQSRFDALSKSAEELKKDDGPLAKADKEIAKLEATLKLTKEEVEFTKKKLEAALKYMAENSDKIEQLLAQNKKLADRLTAYQLNEARKIDDASQATRTPEPAGAGQ